MKKDDVFQFSDGNSYKIQSIETEWVRATKLVNGKPQKGRPAKLARPLVEIVFNPNLAPNTTTTTTTSNASTSTSKTEKTEDKSAEQKAQEVAAKEADDKRFIAESLAMLREGGAVDMETGEPLEEVQDEEPVEDLSKVFE